MGWAGVSGHKTTQRKYRMGLSPLSTHHSYSLVAADAPEYQGHLPLSQL